MPDSPDHIAVFENAFRGYGKIWRPSRGPDARGVDGLRRALPWIARKQTRAVGVRGPIICDLLENETFNALATVHDDYDCVALFSGAVDCIYNSVVAITADPEIVTSWGTPAADFDTKGDTLHRRLGREIGEMACLFIFLHEVGHVVNCHPKFLEETFGVTTLKEIRLGSDEDAISKVCKAFEWEADEYAAIAGYQMFRILHSKNVFGPLKLMHPDHAWSVCLCLTFAFIADASGGEMATASETHPAVLHRYVWSTMSIENAANCRQFSPQREHLQRGYSDVFGWFSKHGVKWRCSEELGDPLSQMKEAYTETRAIFENADKRLKQLMIQRRLGGEEWLRQNPKWLLQDD